MLHLLSPTAYDFPDHANAVVTMSAHSRCRQAAAKQCPTLVCLVTETSSLSESNPPARARACSLVLAASLHRRLHCSQLAIVLRLNNTDATPAALRHPLVACEPLAQIGQGP